eukprot:CAMPEP_0185592902 /NCGR_PEP_ID=MMETSP0434-20130131/69616_1 /TAXON_ID=626734 ORGANISM="Favella taraikaensis, Strain Fe Narragansett Bay" /NCGR_SAMPLE_ID=MMETSP0434 /ASSEMBLY_ACC=CAM_ASM_000379 /LENGTH=60 /DNA_ID=CAMNT_0028219085 /DNA_START=581 /DNA_END=763 /DNA_ORIENTATION=-
MRKHVIKIHEVGKHPKPEAVFELIGEGMREGLFENHLPIHIGEDTLLLYKDGFCNIDKET